ncbi:MAG: hypothetical protein ACOX43_05820 [Bacilli bacterium]
MQQVWILTNLLNLYEFIKSLAFSKFSGRKSVEEVIASDEDAKNNAFRDFVSEKVLPYAKAEPCYIWDISKRYADAIDSVTLLNTPISTALADLENYLNSLIESQHLAGTNPRMPK